MNCPECQELLHRRLDGETGRARSVSEGAPSLAHAAGSELEAHLNECATCREQYAAAQRLLEGVRQIAKPALPADFARTMTMKVLHERTQRQRKMRRRVLVTAALAASVVVMLIATYWRNPMDRVDEDTPKKQDIAVVPTPMPMPREAPLKKMPLPKEEPRQAFAALSQRVADSTRDHAKVVIVAANLDNLPPVPLDPTMGEAGQEVSDSVRSVTRSARKAFDFFARELPMPTTDSNGAH